MENAYIYSLIIAIGGVQLPGENVKGYLSRVSQCTGVDFYSLRAAYYGQYVSKNTRSKLEQAAENARQTDAIIAFTEYHLKIWQADAKLHRPWIDAARAFLDELRRYPETPRDLDLASRDDDVGGEA